MLKAPISCERVTFEPHPPNDSDWQGLITFFSLLSYSGLSVASRCPVTFFERRTLGAHPLKTPHIALNFHNNQSIFKCFSSYKRQACVPFGFQPPLRLAHLLLKTIWTGHKPIFYTGVVLMTFVLLREIFDPCCSPPVAKPRDAILPPGLGKRVPGSLARRLFHKDH